MNEEDYYYTKDFYDEIKNELLELLKNGEDPEKIIELVYEIGKSKGDDEGSYRILKNGNC